MMAEILLAPRELLYIAALLDAPELIGMSDAFFGMDETEMRHEITALQLSLAEKGYAEMDFEGGFALKDNVLKTAGICAGCDTLIIADKNKASAALHREFYYAKNGRIVKMDEKQGIKALTPVSDTDELLGFIMRGIEWQSKGAILECINVSNDILSVVRDQLNMPEPTAAKNLLTEYGCGELSAETIMEGLSGKANYYAAAVMAFEGPAAGTDSIMLIDSKNGIYKMTHISDGLEDGETVRFDALTVKQAEAALTDVVRGGIIRRSGV